jgi:Domain of unknown function (DUF5658)
MTERTEGKTKDRLREARLRETRFLMSFNLSSVNRRLVVLLTVFIVLNFFDALTTLVALQAGPTFVEHNPIAAGLFRLDFSGFLVALALKYLPILPLAYATFIGPKEDGGLAIRIVKVSTLVALVAADLFYLFVVGSNSLNLVAFYR